MNWLILHIYHSALNAFAFSLVLQICEGENLANKWKRSFILHEFWVCQELFQREIQQIMRRIIIYYQLIIYMNYGKKKSSV
jgi:hypothetical protein